MKQLAILIFALAAMACAADVVGRAEAKRIDGDAQACIADLVSAVKTSKDAATLLTVAGWRALELPERIMPEVPDDLQGSWLTVYRLIAAAEAADHERVHQLCSQLEELKEFPNRIAEVALMRHYRKQAVSETEAAFRIVRARNFRALYALRDLDLRLAQEADYFRLSKDEGKAKTVRDARERLRRSYLKASRHAIERLFALKLSGQDVKRLTLLRRLQKAKHLTDGGKLNELHHKLIYSDAWRDLLLKLLDSDLSAIDQPVPEAVLPNCVITANATSEGRIYTGNVKVEAGPVRLEADRVLVSREAGKVTHLLLEDVVTSGIRDWQNVRAATCSFHIRNWRLEFRDDVSAGDRHFVQLSLSSQGDVLARRTLLDVFHDTKEADARRKLVPQIVKRHPQAEWTDEFTYFYALTLVEPHLTWHGLAEPSRWRREMRARIVEQGQVDSPWQEAHRGEAWMRGSGEKKVWRLVDPVHPDVQKAIDLLESMEREKAWVKELKRNNTVLTMDISPVVADEKPVAVLDCRNADTVKVQLYRVERPEQVVAVSSRIGVDFVFRGSLLQAVELEVLVEDRVFSGLQAEIVGLGQPLTEWDVKPANLREIHVDGDWESWDWGDSDDGWYFGDACSAFRTRMNHDYGHDEHTSWYKGRVIELPKETMKQPGCYIVAVSANGRTAYAPTLVEPLKLTMCRSRDGVMTVVQDVDGKKMVEGAQILSPAPMPTAVTDENGVAFAKVFAAGHVPIIAHKDGRYAIDGFGALFGERNQFQLSSMMELKEAEERAVMQVYADRFAAACITDRPVYRPGQNVQAKLIIRRIERKSDAGGRFRADDFDRRKFLRIPAIGSKFGYSIIDPKGRGIKHGQVESNAYGSAAIEFDLNEECATGSYKLQLHEGTHTRVLPHVFQVKYYRRPAFRLEIGDLPTSVKKGEKVTVGVKAEYYFGKAVDNADLHISILTRSGSRLQGKNVNFSGETSATLRAPEESGRYSVEFRVSDGSDRTVVEQRPLLVGMTPMSDVSDHILPFCELGGSIELPEGDWRLRNPEGKMSVVTGKARLDVRGWWQLEQGETKLRIFCYSPKAPANLEIADEKGWVDLSPAHNEGQEPMLGLLGKQRIRVGENVPVLLKIPRRVPRVLITMEGETTLDYHLVEIPTPTPAFLLVQVPVSRRLAPNFYIQAFSLYEGLSSMAERRWSEPTRTRIDVITGETGPGSLTVEIVADRMEYQPGDRVKVDLEAMHSADLPAQSELLLSVVDESVYHFAAERRAQIAHMFAGIGDERQFREKTWRTSGRAYSVEVLQQQMMEAAQESVEYALSESAPLLAEFGEPPISQFPITRLRQDFRETAAWFPQIETDAKGKAHVEFALPDSLTEYRLSALAITKENEFGWGQARIKASLPLSGQVILPRFAMVGDEVELRVLVHNHTANEETVRVRLELSGLEIVDQAELLQAVVAAEESQTLRVPVRVLDTRMAMVKARITTTRFSDAVQRQMPVKRFGVKRTIEQSGTVDGEHIISFPKDLQVETFSLSMSQNQHLDVASALSGLDSLIGYPYGCVEQTMSRFLPSVMLSRAAQHGGIDLPENLVAKLPDILGKGLARLYRFQHADGGWGWWIRDKSHDLMTLYVVHGLLRCKRSGVDVDETVLKRGLDCLASRLDTFTVEKPFIHSTGISYDERTLAARYRLVLARGGRLNSEDATNFARVVLQDPNAMPFTIAQTALMCRMLRLEELAGKLYTRCRDWTPNDPTATAVQLSLQSEFCEPLPDLLRTARRLTGMRRSDGWGNTRATAWAVEALAEIVPLAPRETGKENSFSASYGDRQILNAHDAKGGFRRSLRTTVAPTSIAPLTLRTKGAAAQYALRFSGRIESAAVEKWESDKLALTRQYFHTDGTPVKGPLRPGDVIEVRLTCIARKRVGYVMLEDMRPALCEFADETVFGDLAEDIVHEEFRDDRACFFMTSLASGTYELRYYLRAETVGKTQVLPATVEPMYAPAKCAGSPSVKLQVK